MAQLKVYLNDTHAYQPGQHDASLLPGKHDLVLVEGDRVVEPLHSSASIAWILGIAEIEMSLRRGMDELLVADPCQHLGLGQSFTLTEADLEKQVRRFMVAEATGHGEAA
jgi:hypothetical protein